MKDCEILHLNKRVARVKESDRCSGFFLLHYFPEIPPNYGELDKINKKWNCNHSEKIQKWLSENNSDYRREIGLARGRDKVVQSQLYEEIYVSNMTSENISGFIDIMYKERKLSNNQYFIRNYKTKKANPSNPLSSTPPVPASPDYSERREEEQEYARQYSERARQFHDEDPYDNYDDYLYFERARNGGE